MLIYEFMRIMRMFLFAAFAYNPHHLHYYIIPVFVYALDFYKSHIAGLAV
jgi:hypothetical protein